MSPPQSAHPATPPTPPRDAAQELPIWVARALQHQLLPRCVGDAIARLLTEFPGVDGNIVASAVIGAYRDLQGHSAPALPELVERSARHRIIDARRSPLPSR